MQNMHGTTTDNGGSQRHDWGTNLTHPLTQKKVAYTCQTACSWGDKMGRYDETWDSDLPRYYPKRCRSCTRLKYGREVANKIGKLIKDDKQHCLLTFTLMEKVSTTTEGLSRLKNGIKKLTRTANWNAMFDGWVYCYEEVSETTYGTYTEQESYGEDDFVEYFTLHAHVHMIARRTGTVARITPKQLARLKDDAVRNGLGKVVNVAPVTKRGAYIKKTTRYLAKYIAKRQGDRTKYGTRLWERGGVFRNQ